MLASGMKIRLSRKQSCGTSEDAMQRGSTEGLHHGEADFPLELCRPWGSYEQTLFDRDKGNRLGEVVNVFEEINAALKEP